MNVSLHESSYSCYKKSYSGTKSIDLSCETVVSDKMPDIGLLGEASATVLLRSKRTERGAAMIEGEVSVIIGYIPDGAPGLRKINMMIPWQQAYENENISEIDAAVCDIQIAELETRMLNPRKVLVKLKLSAEMSCYGKTVVSFCDGVESDGELQVLTKKESCDLLAVVCEKSFAVTDEYTLSTGTEGCEVLHQTVAFRVDDVKALMNKLVVKGCVLTDAVVISTDGDTESVSFNSGFSFIAETDCEQISPTTCWSCLPSAVFLDVSADGRRLSLEVHGVCQMLAYRTEEITYVADVYSNFRALTQECRVGNVFDSARIDRRRSVESATIPCRGQSPKIMFSAMDYSLRQDGKIHVKLSCCVRYESGAVDWLRKQLVFAAPTKEGETVFGVRPADVYCGIGSGEIDARVTIEADIAEITPKQISSVCDVAVGEEKVLTDECTLTVVRSKGNIWELAKTYESTVQLISQCNDLEEDELIDEMFLLIPKQF